MQFEKEAREILEAKGMLTNDSDVNDELVADKSRSINDQIMGRVERGLSQDAKDRLGRLRDKGAPEKDINAFLMSFDMRLYRDSRAEVLDNMRGKPPKLAVVQPPRKKFLGIF